MGFYDQFQFHPPNALTGIEEATVETCMGKIFSHKHVFERRSLNLSGLVEPACRRMPAFHPNRNLVQQ